LAREVGVGAALGGEFEHGGVEVQAGCRIAKAQKVFDVRAGAAGEIEKGIAAAAEEFVQPMGLIALFTVVDVCTHEVVATRKVGIQSGFSYQGGGSHETLGGFWLGGGPVAC